MQIPKLCRARRMPTFRLSCRFNGVPMSSISFVSRVRRRDLREPAGQVENQRHYHWHLLQSRVRVEQLSVLLRALLHQLPLHVEVLQEVWVCGVRGQTELIASSTCFWSPKEQIPSLFRETCGGRTVPLACLSTSSSNSPSS